MYAQPLYVANVKIEGAYHNVVYIATEHDSVYAIDAEDGAVLWHVSLINPAAGITTLADSDVNACTDLVPEFGITGTPVIDPSNGTIYFVARTRENGLFRQRLHALNITTGAEIPYSAVIITASVLGTGDGGSEITFDPSQHNNGPGLLLEGGHIVIAWGSQCDNQSFHGRVISFNATTLAQEAVFSTPQTEVKAESGWVVPVSANFSYIYLSTGNGLYDGDTDIR